MRVDDEKETASSGPTLCDPRTALLKSKDDLNGPPAYEGLDLLLRAKNSETPKSDSGKA